MKQVTPNSLNDTEPIIKYTGDPFVDVGGLVIETLPQKTIEEKIHFVTDVYVDNWKGKLDSIFLNSKITNNHVRKKPKLQKENELTYYLDLLKEEKSHEEYCGNGYCRICSNNGALFKGGRHNFPMVGSGDFTNFYHFHEPYVLICKNCLIKLYFMPIGLLQAENLTLLQIQNKYVRELWQKKIILENLDKISKGSSDGILKTTYLKPQNALFKFASDLIENFELYDTESSKKIRLFYFTNFAASSDLKIYDLPNSIFLFLSGMLKPDVKPDWTYFVKKYYWFSKKNFRFDENNMEWSELKKDTETKLDIEEYAGARSNTIYERLLSGKSILKYLKNIHKRRQIHPHIAIKYLKEVKKMKQEQIALIKKIADKIIALCEKESNYKKYITHIEGISYSYRFRKFIIKMIKIHFNNKEQEPFIRSEEYVDYLFPDGQNWDETRDFLLICLYEKLHELKIEPTQILDETSSELEDVGEGIIDEFND